LKLKIFVDITPVDQKTAYTHMDDRKIFGITSKAIYNEIGLLFLNL